MCVYLYTYLFFFLRVSHPTPSFKGQNELWLAKVLGVCIFFKVSKLLWPILKCRGKQVMHSRHCWYAGWWQFYNEKKNGEDHTHDHNVQNASDIWLYLFA